MSSSSSSVFVSLLLLSLLSVLFHSSNASIYDGERISRVTRAQCSKMCGVKMTLECCQCIGCHQGMRFGKRSSGPLFTTVEDLDELLPFYGL